MAAVVALAVALMAGQLPASIAAAAPTAPGLPTMLGATAGDQKATVTWIAPSDGGSAITSYTVYAYGEAAGKRKFADVQFQCGATQCSATVTGLINGTVYTLTVAATNAIGDGPESVHSNNVTPAGKPAKPTDIKAVGGNGAATVSWTAPDPNGSPITGYTLRAYGGAAGKKVFPNVQFRCAASLCSAIASPLVNGTTYTVTVAAVNAVGEGNESDSSNSVTLGAPDAPTNVKATSGSSQATVSWTPPNNNGSVITGYTVTAYVNGVATGTGKQVSGSATTAVVTGLTNMTTYTFTVKATNARGTGLESSPSNAVTVGTPNAPTNVQATSGDQQATVTWTPPGDSGSAILSYTIRAYMGTDTTPAATFTIQVSDAQLHCSTSSCHAPISGLVNGTAYTFTVAAHNQIGDGPESAKSNAVTPAGLPGAPIIGTAKGGNTQATVAWTAPNSNGSPIISYTIRAYSGGSVALTVSAVTCSTNDCSSTVTGLANGTAYTFRVAAVNGVGEGSQSDESNQVIPAANVPGAPTIGTAIPGNKQATVSWTAPGNDGGSPIVSYSVQAYIGNTLSKVVPNINCSTTSCSTTVTGLTNGTAYTFTVIAVNAMGPSAESAASNSVTPNALTPSAPTIGVATAGNGSATVTWTAPPDNGIAISSYTVRAFVGTTESVRATDVNCNTSSCTTTVTGLTNGTTYTFTVAGVNSVGEGAQSALSNAVTPVGAPGPPRNLVATAGNTSATISWSAPASDGGSAITQYTVTLTAGVTSLVQQVPSTGSLQATFTGLTNGTTYGVSVVAINGVDQSSAALTSVTPFGAAPTVPAAPAAVSAASGIQSATVTWSTPSSSSAITGYTITAYTGYTSSVATTLVVGGSVTSATVTGLANGATYTFTVTAINVAGAGPESSRSNAVTLPNVPGAPLNLQVTVQNGTAQITWQPPASDGGRSITSYQITVSDGTHPATVLNSSSTGVTVSGLTNGVTYTVSVAAINAVGQGGSTSAAVTPSAPAANAAPSLNLPGDQTVTYGNALSFDVSGSDPDPGDHLTLSVTGLPGGLTFVDKGNGHGTVSGTVQAPAGSYAAVFTVDDGHGLSVSHPLTITVVPDKALVTPADSNPSAVKVNKVTSRAGSITVKATIAPSSGDSGGDIGKAVPVTCTLRSVNSGATYSKQATTGGAGGSTLAATCKFRHIPVDVYRLRFEIGGQYYTGSSTDFLAVYSPSRASVRASGTITRQGVSASFSMSASYGKGGKMRGSLVYTEHRSAGDVTVRSTVVGGLVFKTHKAYFVGKATLDGGGEYTVVATVLSNRYRKGKDRFGIRLVANHQFVPDLSFSPTDIQSGTAQVAQS